MEKKQIKINGKIAVEIKINGGLFWKAGGPGPTKYPPLVYSTNAAGSTITVNGEVVTLEQGENIVLDYPNEITSVKATKNTALTAIQIPNTVTEIEGSTTNIPFKTNSAFYKCTSLRKVTLPDTIVSIGRQAFTGCTSLVSINIPNSVTSIGNSAFSGCASLVSINIPKGIRIIDTNTFNKCTSLRNVRLPDTITSIGESSFGDCTSLASIKIPNSVTSIGIYAFGGTALTSITIPNSVTSFGERVFANCKLLGSVTLPDTVTSIGFHTFYKTALSGLNYIGTMSQWSSITLAENWNEGSAIKVVYCTDGDVTL